MKNYSNKKEDQRVRITKGMLKQALMQLLREKSIQSITIKELCELAQVNRGTFYSHYYDIYDLLEDMENELLAELETLLNGNPVIVKSASEQSSQFFASIFSFLLNNKEMCAILLGENGDKNFVSKIIEMGKEKCIEEYGKLYPSVSVVQSELYYTFIASGFLAIFQYWLENEDRVSIETIAKGAERIILEGVRFFDQPL